MVLNHGASHLLTILKPIAVNRPSDAEGFQPFARQDDTLARPWAIPGMPGMEHRLSGIEKQDVTGHLSQDPANHQRMTDLRQEKLDAVAKFYPETEVEGDESGSVLIIGWGSPTVLLPPPFAACAKTVSPLAMCTCATSTHCPMTLLTLLSVSTMLSFLKIITASSFTLFVTASWSMRKVSIKSPARYLRPVP